MRSLSQTVLCLIAGIFVIAYADVGPPPRDDRGEYEKLRKEGEKLFAEGSYGRAHEVYLKADDLDLPEESARWVDFRLADTLWRSEASTKTADTTKLDRARKQLDALVRDVERVEDRGRVWVEVQESLGDYWWTRRGTRNWGQAWTYYQRALDWWAGSEVIDEARGRYIGIVWRIARPRDALPYYYYGYYGNILPVRILRNVLEIAPTENDRAHAHYLIAMTIRQQGGDWFLRKQVPEEFEAALAGGKKTEWHDDALFHYAEWMANQGRATLLEDAQWTQKADYVRAVELYRLLLQEYQKGETRYYDQAKQRILNITRPALGLSVSNIFLPGSEIQHYLNWRNVKRIDLDVYPVDLTKDIAFAGEDRGSGDWLQTIDVAGREKAASWSHETGDKGDHRPGGEILRLEERLPVGAYLLEAKAGEHRARDLILVTDISVVLKTSGDEAVVWVCNVLDGSPLAGADVKLWERRHDGRKWNWYGREGKTNDDGLAVFDFGREADDRDWRDLYVGAALKDRQSFGIGGSYYSRRAERPWRIYAFTDRPAYRPNETARWKLVARQHDGSVYSTPSGQTIHYEINDPRGAKIKEGDVKLNLFGSAWGSIELTAAMPLGEYQAHFWTPGREDRIGAATLFRIEEYKLPEFKVEIATPEVDGKKKAFRLGESVEVEIGAEYYFGGPVARATVEVLVYQNPFYFWWSPPRDFPWFYEDMTSRYRPWLGDGQLIKRETLKTDDLGKAKLTFETPAGSQQDFEYRIEARVTDASRREIVGTDSVRVTRRRYHVYLHPRHYIHRPQDEVTIDIKAIDANDQPVAVTGLVTVTRDWWYEIWLDPDGKEVKGEELERVRAEMEVFPPLPGHPQERGWTLKFRGYQHDEILKRPVKTDAEGKAEFTFTPEREGYYQVAWSSKDGDLPVTTSTTVWVATRSSRDLGYRQGAVEIIVDKDTFRVGQKAPVMLSVPTNDRYVLFSVEGEDLYSYRVVHVEGTAKLIELEIDETHVPNVYLGAAMVTHRELHLDTEQVVVPPIRNFLDVEVKCDRDLYQPREEGTLSIVTRDQDGKPVSAEVAIGLVDESVYYIQPDYAGDPRKFYYGSKRGLHVQTNSTFQWKNYIRLVEGKDSELIEATGTGEAGGWGKRHGAGGGGARGRAKEEREDGFFGEAAPDESVGLDMEAAEGAPAPGAPRRSLARRPSSADKKDKGGPAGDGEPAVQVRSDFRSTVLWAPDVVTDEDGRATVDVKFPDSLTGWKATARVQTRGNRFGIGGTATRTRKPLIARLQAPRFFVVGDEATVSAVVNNNTDKAMTVTPSIEVEGVRLAGILIDGERIDGTHGPKGIPPIGEHRFDWAVAVEKPGEAKITVIARADDHSDAMQRLLVVHEHGMDRLISKSGKVRADDVTVKIDVPAARRKRTTEMTIQVSPSIAVTMLDALPYLIDYPYGCTEQTMSRFLPAAITAKTLEDLGVRPAEVMQKVFGGIERAHEKETHPEGKKDLDKLDEMIEKGLDRLYDFQHPDGGWGWWKGGRSDHFMSAYVVWGLTLAREAGIDVRKDVIERGAKYLDVEIVEEEEHPDMQAWMLHGMAAYHASHGDRKRSDFQTKAFDNLWKGRDRLNAYSRALLALSAHHFGDDERARTLVRNLQNGVKIDKSPDTSIVQRGEQESEETVIGTAHWGEDGIWWRWSDGGVEATSFALRALLKIDPKNELIEPVMNWLVKGRRGAQWSNTRDTAITILALNDYLRQSGELNPEIEYEVLLNGESVAKKKLTAEDALGAPSRFAVGWERVEDGTNEIRIVRTRGEGPIYFAIEAGFFSEEEPIPPAGNEIFVRRQYHRLVGQPTLLKGYVYHKVPLEDGAEVTSGDRIEATITIEAKNNYEYLVFEDLKPAGLEAVQIRSGEALYAKELKSGAVDRQFGPGESKGGAVEKIDYTGRSRWVYQELRDRKVALFVDKMPEGVWEIRYDLRAEVPGKFHALPVKGFAMYVPEIRCNGAESRLTVEDKPPGEEREF